MAFDWFNAAQAEQFGTALAKFYAGKLPLGVDKSGKKEFVANKMAEQVSEFKLEHKLNFYKKAQLGNAFKWTLKEAGYTDEEINQLTGVLMRQL